MMKMEESGAIVTEINIIILIGITSLPEKEAVGKIFL
jgi:hypothetical protein